MQDKLQALLQEAKNEIGRASALEQVEALRVRYLGKKGALSAILGGMGKLSPDERRSLGEVANKVKGEVEALLADAISRAEDQALESELKGPKIDVTQPGRVMRPGKRHPLSRTLDEMVATFRRLGFEVASGPEIELDFFNFEALNLPKDHPARDMQDTFYVDSSFMAKKPESPVLLRTHTSPVQVRTMLAKRTPPVRVICPGRVYRRDSDITHTPMFHQVEGLLVDKDVSFAELKGTLDAFVKAFFGSNMETRLRPSFFPFTEPSAEVDITCVACRGKGCRICKQTGWLEVLGAGMVHPNVLRYGGHDPAKVTGFAFGLGVERVTMLRYGLDDLRALFENDPRFIEQF